ncbi:MAG TPA: hypothetical protein VJ654_14135 [Noviherbaspirillum sp.]|nr:hypothetical protein [Noviherbaspirillum sp.]
MTGELTQEQKEKAARLVARLLDPEDLGHAVSPEVRDMARAVLGIPMAETERWQ